MKNTPAFHSSSSLVGPSLKAVFPSMNTRPLAALALVISFAFQPLYGQVPKWIWAKDAACGWYSNQQVTALASDPSGNSYVAGIFGGGAYFDPELDPGSIIIASSDQKGFLSKYENLVPGGWRWALSFQGTGREEIRSMVLDSLGNVYLGGSFSGTTDFDPGPEIVEHTATGSQDGFICKLDSAGAFIWVMTFQGEADSDIRVIRVNPAGDLVVMGVFDGSMDADPGPDTNRLVSLGSLDIFIAELDTDGQFHWARQMGGQDSNEAMDMVIDTLGNIYLTGISQDTLDADPGPGYYPLGSGSYAIRLDGQGQLDWARQFGGADAVSRAIQVEPGGNLVIAGVFGAAGDFDPGTDTIWMESAGEFNTFLLKMSKDGQLHWVKGIGGTGANEVNSLLVSGNSIFLAGIFRGAVDVDPGPGEALLISQRPEWDHTYLLRFDSTGQYEWALQSTSLSGKVNALLPVSGNKLALGGTYNSWVEFGQWTAGWCKGWWDDASSGGFVALAGGIEGSMPTVLKGPVTDVRCHGELSGGAIVEGSGGTPPYAYRWSNGSFANELTGVGAIRFEVTVTDALGSTAVAAVNITQPAKLRLIANTVSAEAGTIDVTFEGGIEPYQYLWTSPTGEVFMTEDLAGLVDFGTYHLQVTDANGCTKTYEFLFEDPQTATHDASAALPLRFYPNPANDVIHIQGDQVLERIEVFGIDGRPCLQVTNPISNQLDISGLPEGCYQVRATDGRQWFIGRVLRARG